MKLKPRIKVVLAEKDVKQVEIAKYYLEQTGEEVTAKRVKSISNTISRYARGELNPPVLLLFYFMEKYLNCRLSDLYTPEE
jgi:hypothetical protein